MVLFSFAFSKCSAIVCLLDLQLMLFSVFDYFDYFDPDSNYCCERVSDLLSGLRESAIALLTIKC